MLSTAIFFLLFFAVSGSFCAGKQQSISITSTGLQLAVLLVGASDTNAVGFMSAKSFCFGSFAKRGKLVTFDSCIATDDEALVISVEVLDFTAEKAVVEVEVASAAVEGLRTSVSHSVEAII